MLKKHEGFRAVAYTDITGHQTIAYGRNLDANPLTPEEGTYLLNNDINRTIQDLYKSIPWLSELDEVRQCAMIDLAFNLGVNGLMGFKTFLSLLQKRYWVKASSQLLSTLYARQVGKRAKEIALMILSGEWPCQS